VLRDEAYKRLARSGILRHGFGTRSVRWLESDLEAYEASKCRQAATAPQCPGPTDDPARLRPRPDKERTRSAPVWFEGDLWVFPPGAKGYFRILGTLPDGTRVDTSGGRSKQGAVDAAKEHLSRARPGVGAHIPAAMMRTRCRDLTQPQFKGVVDKARLAGYAPNTVEGVGSKLRAMVNCARTAGYLDPWHDPMYGAKYTAGGRRRHDRAAPDVKYRLCVPPSARPTMTDKDRLASAITRYAPPWWGLGVHLAGEAGPRWGEQIAITRSSDQRLDDCDHLVPAGENCWLAFPQADGSTGDRRQCLAFGGTTSTPGGLASARAGTDVPRPEPTGVEPVVAPKLHCEALIEAIEWYAGIP
jgi:hypothetical protein